MTSFVFNLLLAIAWAALIGSFSLTNLLLGYGVGAIIIWFSRSAFDGQVYLAQFARLFSLIVWTVGQFCRAGIVGALRATSVGRPKQRERVELPLSLDRDEEIAALIMILSSGDHSLPISITTGRGGILLEREITTSRAERTVRERKVEQWLMEALR